MKRITAFIIFSLLVAAASAQPTNTTVGLPSEDEISYSFDDRFSTNWYAAVRAALPAGYLETGRHDFHAATNGLGQESAKGNLAAQGLWGIVLLVSKESPEAGETGLKLLREAAEQGEVAAMINLGYLFENGRYVRRNFNEAFYWFNRAAEAGVAEGQLQLGGCYHYGMGTTPNLTEAAKYYRLAAEHTNYVAMKSLGYLLMNGYGVAKNEREARVWLERAAKEGGNRRAMYNLGVLCSRKYPDPQAMGESFKWMKQSAEAGDPLGADALANAYYWGHGGVETNLALYRLWRFKAALLGATESQYLMGQAYRTGDGVPKDAVISAMWYQKAAAKNHPLALYDLALHYQADKTNRAARLVANECMVRAAQMGHREAQFQCAMSLYRGEVMLSAEPAKQWLFQAAEGGWPKAEFCLFLLYNTGLQPGKDYPAYPKDKTEANQWLRRAAEHEHYQAQSILAVMLIRGQEVAQDKAAAEKFLRHAAGHGFALAQNDLGFSILNGDLATTDKTEAAMWCQLAAEHEPNPNLAARARINLSNAQARLTPEQREEARQRAENFQALKTPEMNPMNKDWRTHPQYQQEDGRFGH